MWASHCMCHHVLCLSPYAPPLSTLPPHKFPSSSFFFSHSSCIYFLGYIIFHHKAKRKYYIILISSETFCTVQWVENFGQKIRYAYTYTYIFLSFLLVSIIPGIALIVICYILCSLHSAACFLLLIAKFCNFFHRMKNPSSEKLEFLQKWMKGMEKCNSLKKSMSMLERKKAIKVSADLAMASTRTKTNNFWRQALIANIASRDQNSKVLTEHILGSSSQCSSLIRKSSFSSSSSSLVNRSRKIMKRIRRRTVHRRVKKLVMADSIARKMIQKRREMLKRLIPGGDLMGDDVSLLEETLDYIQSLRSQVQVMRSLLVTTSHLMKS